MFLNEKVVLCIKLHTNDAGFFFQVFFMELNYIWFININLNIMHFIQSSYFIALYKCALVIFCSMRPLVAKAVSPPYGNYAF